MKALRLSSSITGKKIKFYVRKCYISDKWHRLFSNSSRNWL